MNHRHRKVLHGSVSRHHLLHALFDHPVSANISMKDVMHVLEELGAELDNKSGNRVGVRLNGHTAAFTHAQHSLPKEEVAQIRAFLDRCGIDPAGYPA